MSESAGITAYVEVEAKWRVHPPFIVPDLTGEMTGVAVAEPQPQLELRAVYWDTADLRLAREGVTLRHRSGEGKKDGWHLKLPTNSDNVPDASTGIRTELHAKGDSEAIPAELRSLITPLVRTSVLGPVATLVTQRKVLLLKDSEDNDLAELTDDLVSVVSSGHVAGRFREIEVEAAGETGIATLGKVGEVLRSRGAVGGEFVPKVVRALGPQATAEPDPPKPEVVPLKAPAHAAVRSILRGQVRTLLAEDLALRRGGDDAVHKMRVAARRLRSTLQTFAPLLDEQWAMDLRDELTWFADSLGQARDSEVLLDRLTRSVEELPDDLVIGDIVERLTKAVGGDLTSGAETTTETMASERYVVLLERLVDAAWEPLTTPMADGKTGDVLPQLVEVAWDTLNKRVKRMYQADAIEADWHKSRIAAKRTRYAAEAVEPIFGSQARAFAKRMAEVQTLLGEHQDASIAAEVLRKMASAPRIGAAGFTLGVLHSRQTDAMRDARAAFPKVWDIAKAPRLRRWLSG